MSYHLGRFVRHRWPLLALAGLLLAMACGPVGRLFVSGGQQQLHARLQPVIPHTLVLVFAMDGAGYDQFMAAVDSGGAKHIAALLGRRKDTEIYAHAYAIANAISVLPTTVPAWTSIFTGQPPAYTGVTGDEFFIREWNRFYAPVPVSVDSREDTYRMLSNDLLGKLIETPTVYEMLKLRSYVALNGVYRGADVFTDLDRTAYADIAASVLDSVIDGTKPYDAVVARIDEDSTTAAIGNLRQRGLPDLQVVYFPGIDLFTHHTRDPLRSQQAYLETVTDDCVGRILDYYRQAGALDHTYVLFIADHGHTPVLHDHAHALGSEEDADLLPLLLKKEGFRTRKFALNLPPDQQDYQAVVAYEGVMAYVYLADRSLCRQSGSHCPWAKPARLKGDVMPVVRALYRSSRYGRPIPQLKGKLDLIFARAPVPPGQNTRSFDIFDGRKLLPIPRYLASHPRPDLIQLDRRMKWLGTGPYGDRAGDIVVLPRFNLEDPINDRYYFGPTYYSEHGSPSLQDSHIPFVLARPTFSGELLRAVASPALHADPTQLDVTPLIRRLLRHDIMALEAEASSEIASGSRPGR